ncbi:NADPH:quinone reductase-like Zn-dependent oxidoreductase [Caldalkalibacillus uzonensis]|uniref:NADPH:quinone reductase-like Zn-dependent oxidoreductase n=1 Tax=Caldalkalibacillus uzonensis TaxID=353224 RepID=A0ABU0CWA6_9BACI|nr:zinc-binding dehydrogenase [Caldalkalibacillus uzonensis]MDQ0340398.1 NADPH:quinone reductase-like Zn-dependent oxidoreductase [Caldalkalibacillus uzonensis]
MTTFLLQMAKALGATVYVTSRSQAKREQALALGADRAIHSEEDWSKQLKGEKVDVMMLIMLSNAWMKGNNSARLPSALKDN